MLFAVGARRSGTFWRDFDRDDLDGFNREAGALLSEVGYEPADPRQMPRRRRAPRVPARPGRPLRLGRVRRRLPGRRLRVDRRGQRAGAQGVVDDVLAAIRKGDPGDLERFLDPSALVRVIDGTGSVQVARGSDAIQLVHERLASDDAFGARQTRGDVFPALPQFGVVLTFAPRTRDSEAPSPVLRAARPQGRLARRVPARLSGQRWQPTVSGTPTPVWARSRSASAAGCGYRSPPDRPRRLRRPRRRHRAPLRARRRVLARTAGPAVPSRSPITSWNEPNHQPFWCPRPDPETWAELAIVAGEAVHAADPEAQGQAPPQVARRVEAFRLSPVAGRETPRERPGGAPMKAAAPPRHGGPR
jgi:hypothetical protein